MKMQVGMVCDGESAGRAEIQPWKGVCGSGRFRLDCLEMRGYASYARNDLLLVF